MLEDVAGWLWLFLTGAASARIAFGNRKRPTINLQIYDRPNETKERTDECDR